MVRAFPAGIAGLLALCLVFALNALSFAESAEGGDALLKKARELSAEGRAAEALETAHQAVKVEPDNAAAQETLGSLLLDAGRAEEALAAFEAALRQSPGLRTARTGKGLALLKKGDTAAAEAALKEALVTNPNPSTAHYGLGLLYERRGEYDKAIEQYKEGLKKSRGRKK